MVEKRVRLVMLALALLVVTPALAAAAEFDLVTDLSSTSVTPDDLDAPCASEAAAAAQASTSAGEVDIDADAAAEADGDDDSCNETARASATGHGLYNLIPNGNQPGDPVPVCIQVFMANLTESTGDAAAEVERNVALVEAISGSGRRPLVRIPSTIFATEGDQSEIDELACSRQVTMRVGEQLEARIGGTGTAQVFGVGTADAVFSFDMHAAVGTCVVDTECPNDIPAPAVSSFSVVALAGMLLLSGVAVRRRHQARRR